ncbi:hypothetical protein, partial [Faecalibaculum rodentium]|uniref:hypothetical protein n=1 Tax=Faecalibaculum rodentium TaxID=1702221 RepID=UPI00262ED5A6
MNAQDDPKILNYIFYSRKGSLVPAACTGKGSALLPYPFSVISFCLTSSMASLPVTWSMVIFSM